MRILKKEIYFPILILIHFVFRVIDLYMYNGSYEYTSKHIAGEVFSSWVVTVFAANFLMATRATWVEKIVGDLDKMYISIDIKNTSVFISGPEVIRESYIRQLLHKGV